MRHSVVCLAFVFTVITIARSDGARLPAPAGVYTAQAARQQTEADRRFAELVKSSRSRNVENPTGVLEQLQRFAVDYPNDPRLDTFVYPTILATVFKVDPARAKALADEFLAKFPDKLFLRFRAYDTKFSALEVQKDQAAIRALGQQVLETETRSDILERAAEFDTSGALPLLDKAIAERIKHPGATEPPTLADLRWSYARSLERAGRTGESLKLAIAVIDEMGQAIADLSLADLTDRRRSGLEYLQEVLADRYETFIRWCTDGGRRELAVQYLARQEGVVTRLQSRAHIETGRAALFGKLGRPDLALDCLVRAFAERMEQATYDTIATLAQKVGRAADTFYARARNVRNRDARPLYRFDLATDDGKRLRLADIRAKVLLVNFFYPT